MMEIGKPSARTENGNLVFSAPVSLPSGRSECFYSVPLEYADMADTERSSCFLAAFLYPAMRLGEDLHVAGTVSARLLFNANEFIIPLMASCDSRLKRVKVSAGSVCDVPAQGASAVGTGFSGGIDSFATICTRLAPSVPPGFALTHLFFFNVGAHGVPRNPGDMDRIERQFRARYAKFKAFPEETGLPFVPVDSNVHAFHPWGHLETATFATLSAVMFLARGVKRYYLASSGHTYRQLWKFLGDGGRPDAIERLNMMLLPWLSCEGLDFVDDGNFMDRSRKTALVADYPPARRYLNVCYGHDTLDTNCSVCGKCARTLLTLDVLGRLDDFSAVFDIPRYRREVRRRLIAETIAGEKRNLFSLHLMDLARERGVDLRREVSALDILRARLSGGRIHALVKSVPFLRRAARALFRRKEGAK